MNLQSLRAGTYGSYDARPFASLLSELLVSRVVSQGWAQPLGATAAILFAGRGRDFTQIFLMLHTLDMKHGTCLSVVHEVLWCNSASAIPFRKFLYLFKKCLV